MKVGDLVRWCVDGDLGMIIEIQSDGAYFVKFFNGSGYACTAPEIGVVNQ